LFTCSESVAPVILHQSHKRCLPAIATMRYLSLAAAFVACILVTLPTPTAAVNILVSNDRGWAELNIRSTFNILEKAGHNMLLVAPADDQSGTGWHPKKKSAWNSIKEYFMRLSIMLKGYHMKKPWPRKLPCQYNTCHAHSGPVGRNESDHRFNWVNGYPGSVVEYGINHTAKEMNWGPPDLVVSGINPGCKLTKAQLSRRSLMSS